MKKILPSLFLLLILGAGGAAVYLFQKPARAAGSTAAVAYLPADTQVLLAIPDLNKACADGQATDLYKIWSEPEVQAFLAKPLSKLPPHPEVDEALAKVGKLGLTNLFIALASLDESSNEPRIVAGFQFKGSSADVDGLLGKAKEEFRKQHPAAKADLVNYEGHAIETVTWDEHSTLASAYLGDWYLAANDLALLKATLDRAEHRGPAGSQPTLDKDPDYTTVMAKLPAGHATLVYARPKSFLTKIFDLAEASGQAVDAAQRAEAEKVKAIGATTTFEGGKVRDTIYVHAPGISQELAKLQRSSLPLTTRDTVFYASSMINIPKKFALPAGTGDDEGAAGTTPYAFLQKLGELGKRLNASGITLETFQAAFINEASLHIDWPADRAQPTLIVSLDVRDRDAAGKFVDHLTTALSGGDEDWETSEKDGLTLHSLDLPNVPNLAPTLTVTPKHLLFGLNAPEVQAAAAREAAPAPNFTASDAYQAASGEVGKPNVSFGYLDSKTFFERFYGTLKPFALTASFLLPQINDYVDLGKLPEPETVAKHLSPTVLSESYTADGCLYESVGSFTYGQAAAVFVGGAFGAAMQFVPKPDHEEVEAASKPKVSLAVP